MNQPNAFLRGLISSTLTQKPESIEQYETLILRLFPEPKEGYRLIVSPPMDLPRFHSPRVMKSEGSLSFGRTLDVEVTDVRERIVSAWMTKILASFNFGGRLDPSSYKGVATFGPPDAPLLRLEGIFPTTLAEVDMNQPEPVAWATMSFDFTTVVHPAIHGGTPS